MRRSEIIKSINTVQDAIELSGITEAIYGSLKERDINSTSKIISAANKFSILYNSFTDSEKEILEIFDLSVITDIEKLVKYLINTDKTSSIILDLRSSLFFFQKHAFKLVNLFKQSHSEILENPQNPQVAEQKASLTLILPELDNQSSSPERLKESIEAIILLYKVCAEINDESSHDLSVLSIDSGSDKSFDFLGNAKVIECLKDFFFTLWDRIVFYREKKIDQRLELIAKAIPLMEKVNELEKADTLGPEQAEIFRRNISDGVAKIMKTGAVIPELEDNNHYNVRQLMAPEPKMLTEGLLSSDKKEIENDDNHSNLTEEEEEQLKRLIDKRKKG